MQKWNLREKLGKENLDYKSQPWRKVNGQSQQSKVNAVNGQRMTSARWRDADVSRWLDVDAARVDVALMTSRVTSAGVEDGVCGAWDMWDVDADASGSTWERVRSPMTTRLSPMSRSMQDDLSDASKNVIWAIFAAVMTRAVICAV